MEGQTGGVGSAPRPDRGHDPGEDRLDGSGPAAGDVLGGPFVGPAFDGSMGSSS